MNRRAQFTMYVILGIIILAVVGIGLYIREQSVENKIGQEADKVIAEFLAKGVENYINQCLASVSDEGLRRIGLQGGMLLNSQGGPYLLEPSKKGEEFLLMKRQNEDIYVFYGIRQREGLPGPPDYPAPGSFDSYDAAYFGRNTLTKLCDKDGPNRPGVSSQVAHPCLAGTYNNLDSELIIQKQLQEYVVSSMEKCVNLSFYLQRSGHNISLDGKVESEVIFGYNGVTFSLTYPLTVRIRNSEPVKKTQSFNTFSRVRFKEIYNLAYTLINKEIADISFSAAENYSTLSQWSQGMLVTIANDTCTTCTIGRYDNIIFIQDSKSTIRGEPYVFQFAVQNRRPALDYIWENMSAGEGVDVEINITAIDPDDNVPAISFSGWRQDFITDPQKCEQLGDNIKEGCFDNIDNYDNKAAHISIAEQWNWSDSLSNNRITHSVSLDADKGKHHFNIIVADEEGLQDWQDIPLFVG